MTTTDPGVHRAFPQATMVGGIRRCEVCGQRITKVMGGQGPTWVHADSGAVAAPNPPRQEWPWDDEEFVRVSKLAVDMDDERLSLYLRQLAQDRDGQRSQVSQEVRVAVLLEAAARIHREDA